MHILRIIITLIMLLMFSVSCSGITRQMRNEAMPPVPFKTLVQNVDQYIGETVILGGYILEIENKPEETIIRVLQAPLSFEDAPQLRDKSEGRFVVIHKGFLDPEIYYKDRRITVAGTILGRQTEQIGSCPYECLKLESREIHIWTEYEYRNYYMYDDPFYYPSSRHFISPYRRYPFYRYPYYPYYRYPRHYFLYR